MATTQDVLDHHLKALRAGDIEEVMADYDDSSVLATQQATLRGHTPAFREFFLGAVTDLLPPGSQLEVTTQVVDGDHAYIVLAWRVREVPTPPSGPTRSSCETARSSFSRSQAR